MKDALLTDKQKDIIRLRKMGLTMQAIADQLGTSKENIWAIERAAIRNIRMAERTLEFFYTLDAEKFCVIPAGTPIKDMPDMVQASMTPTGVKILYDAEGLIERIVSSVPRKILGRRAKEEIGVYLNALGDLYFL